MCINVECNRYDDGIGTHVSVYAHLMHGENDDHLQWPFTGRVTIELLNQLEDNGHFSKLFIFASNHEASQRVLNKECASSGYGYAWSLYPSL